MRLNKYIASSGIASRRNSEELIKQGRVSINSEIVMDLASNVDPDKDLVEIDGEKISLKKFLYFLLNKPKGFITSTKDEKSRPVVIELIKTNEKIFPVGRLDYNTTGVLILTNDGDFSNLLTHPRNKVPKVYHAIIDRPLSPEDQVKLTKNLILKDGKGRFEKVTFVKKHGCTIQDLSLIGMGSVVLDGAVVETNSIVAAGAVVRPGFIVPAGKLVAGVPAKIIRDLTQAEIDDFEESAKRYKKYSELTANSLYKVTGKQ